MKFRRPGTASRRVRKIWYSVGATVGGTVLLVGLVLFLEWHRNTDLADPSENITSFSTDSSQSGAPPFEFSDVTQELGITMRHGPGHRSRILTEDTGSGAAWGDIDDDGDWDLYIVNFPGPQASDHGVACWNRLYRNDGDRFTDITQQAGVADAEGFGMGAWFIDLDTDGDQDLYVTNVGANRLFENQGDGTFLDIAARSGVDDDAWSTGAAWGDFDQDGDLDFYLCNYVDFSGVDFSPHEIAASMMGSTTVPFTLNPNSFDPVRNRLYRNLGDAVFEDVAVEFGVDDPGGRSLTATFCDIDGDGRLDLYVNNDVSTNRLFRNRCAPIEDTPASEVIPFDDMSTLSGTADPRGSMGLSVNEIGNMNNLFDGLPDLFITHWVAQENALYQSVSAPEGLVLFLDKTRDFRLGERSVKAVGWGCVFADFDLDGRSDIAVANGSTLEDKSDRQQLRTQSPFLFWNDGRQFHDIAPDAGVALAAKRSARGLAAADFDNDGDVDLFMTVNRGSPILLRNDTPTENHALKIVLSGPPAVCFGARVELLTGQQRQMSWWGCDSSYLSMHSTELLFGLGTAEKVDRIVVRWADGRETVRTEVSHGRLTIEYPLGHF
jgi:hypothetical protein